MTIKRQTLYLLLIKLKITLFPLKPTDLSNNRTLLNSYFKSKSSLTYKENYINDEDTFNLIHKIIKSKINRLEYGAIGATNFNIYNIDTVTSKRLTNTTDEDPIINMDWRMNSLLFYKNITDERLTIYKTNKNKYYSSIDDSYSSQELRISGIKINNNNLK